MRNARQASMDLIKSARRDEKPTAETTASPLSKANLAGSEMRKQDN
jgi:hypothetical protein